MVHLALDNRIYESNDLGQELLDLSLRLQHAKGEHTRLGIAREAFYDGFEREVVDTRLGEITAVEQQRLGKMAVEGVVDKYTLKRADEAVTLAQQIFTQRVSGLCGRTVLASAIDLDSTFIEKMRRDPDANSSHDRFTPVAKGILNGCSVNSADSPLLRATTVERKHLFSKQERIDNKGMYLINLLTRDGLPAVHLHISD